MDLVQDLTLPLISLFTGAGFNRIIKESFEAGAHRIEDLWLKCAAASAVAPAHLPVR